MAKTFMILTDSMGSGDPELGRILMGNFLYTLARNEVAPARLMFANAGVRLACEGSTALEDLELLAEKGVPIGSCGTCLDHLGLRDALAVGSVGTMSDSVALLCGDADVVTIA
jgi:selenium metabolism protein YedF